MSVKTHDEREQELLTLLRDNVPGLYNEYLRAKGGALYDGPTLTPLQMVKAILAHHHPYSLGDNQ